MSGERIPEVFLRGCGVPEPLIVNLKSLIGALDPIQFYNSFMESGTNRGLLSGVATQISNADPRKTSHCRHFGPKTLPGEPQRPPPSPRFVPVSRGCGVLTKRSLSE